MIHGFTADVEDWTDGIPMSAVAKVQLPSRLDRGLGRFAAAFPGEP